ncbi:EG45-like domain containing protein [Olea europaea var. sylvestris]|uniref:EG45-like domain containing protein n=1 Tax=Olea europaea var. sylvestris TaxID=158386 RepID=UPI000C1CE841|nr:EG45-like domain containing protein [Olea europaea var. sylvestris]
MGFQIRVLMMLSMSICLASVVHAKQGTSVFYNPPYLPSACFSYRNQGIMIAGANPTLYDGGKVCGRRYKVRCLGGTNETPNPCKGGEVIVRIVDLCTGCGANEINLSRDAFSRIANVDAGRVRVDYIQV